MATSVRKQCLGLVPGCLLVCILLAGCSTSAPPTAQNDEPSAASPTSALVADLRSKVTKWQHNRDKLTQLLAQLETDRQRILQQLDALHSAEHAGEPNPRIAILGGELQDIVHQSAASARKSQEYELAILKSESKLRSVERQLAAEDAGVSDTELTDCNRTMLAMDESLSADAAIGTSSATVDEMVKEQLAEFKRRKEDERKREQEEESRRSAAEAAEAKKREEAKQLVESYKKQQQEMQAKRRRRM